MLTSQSYFDLIEMFQQAGCAICHLLLRDVKRLLDSTLYEFVTDPDIHKIFRASRGLCNEHGNQIISRGNALSIAVLYHASLDEILKILDRNTPEGSRQSALARRLFPQTSNASLVDDLEPTGSCMACRMVHASEEQYLTMLSEAITDARMQVAYEHSEGLCLEHFKRVLGLTTDEERSKLLVSIQQAIWRRLQAELAEFIRKYDFATQERIGTEGDSWRRTVASLSGERGIFGPRLTTK